MPTADESTPELPYVPFPGFLDWAIVEFDSGVIDRFRELLEMSKSNVDADAQLHALAVATRYAAVDTGAIEGLYAVDRGFTRTIATQAPRWEDVLQARGDSVRVAILDAVSAYDFVRESSAAPAQISERWIREVHELVCASQDTYVVETRHGPQQRPLPRGVYKSEANSPTLTDGSIHAYAPVLDTPPEMARLVNELRSEAFLAAHPIMQASYAHYAYVCIHPFSDGNGRVARALASLYLYSDPGVPLVVFADQRTQYLDALESADGGDFAPFVSFMEQRTLDAIGIVRTHLKQDSSSLPTTVAQIAEIIENGGVDQTTLATVSRTRGLLSTEFGAQMRKLGLPSQIEMNAIQIRHAQIPTPTDYAPTGPSGDLLLRVRSAWPVQIGLRRSFAIFVRATATAPSDFVCKATEGDDLEFWLREISPSVTESFQVRVSAWAEGHIDEVAAQALALLREK